MIKERNKYILQDKYYIGYTANGTLFLFDIDDFDKIKDIRWNESNGYIISPKSGKNGKHISMHRLITNADSNMQVDHINHNKADNRKSNLRVCSHQQNDMNRLLQKNNKSGISGVFYNQKRKKWVTTIMHKGKRYYLGEFVDLQDAKNIRKQAELKYYKEFRLN